jgi:hypothetical protein
MRYPLGVLEQRDGVVDDVGEFYGQPSPYC